MRLGCVGGGGETCLPNGRSNGGGGLAGFRATGAAPGGPRASLPLYTALGFPRLLVLPSSSPYLLIGHQEVHE